MNRKVIIIIGPPGCGKGTQINLIEDKFPLQVLEMGNILRNISEENNKESRFIKSYLLKGKLLPDEYVLDIVENFILKSKKEILFFDGFPRYLSQAKSMENIFNKYNINKYFALEIKIKNSEVLKRLKIRGRADDNPDTIKARIKQYDERTKPLILYFNKIGILYDINGEDTVENVHRSFCRVLSNIL